MRFSLPSEKVTLSTDLFDLKGSPSNPGPTSGSFGILSPAVWQALLHFRYLQALLIRDLNQMNQLQGSSFVMLSDPRGNQLVATESRNSQWLPNYNTIFKSDNIHGYLFVRLGSCLWELQNQWEVVCQRDTVAYKMLSVIKGAQYLYIKNNQFQRKLMRLNLKIYEYGPLQ